MSVSIDNQSFLNGLESLKIVTIKKSSDSGQLCVDDKSLEDIEIHCTPEISTIQIGEFGNISFDLSSESLTNTLSGRTFQKVINSNSFNLETVFYFFQEVANFADFMISNKGFKDLPVIWSIFKISTNQQVETFEVFLKTSNYFHALELLWLLEKVTNFQKTFLDKCVSETVVCKNAIIECSKSWKMMLNIQDQLVMKLIATLQKSKIDKESIMLC